MDQIPVIGRLTMQQQQCQCMHMGILSLYLERKSLMVHQAFQPLELKWFAALLQRN